MNVTEYNKVKEAVFKAKKLPLNIKDDVIQEAALAVSRGELDIDNKSDVKVFVSKVLKSLKTEEVTMSNDRLRTISDNKQRFSAPDSEELSFSLRPSVPTIWCTGNPETAWIQYENRRNKSEAVLSLIDSLPEFDQQCMTRHHIEGETQAEIAESLGVSQSKVSKSVQRSMQYLKDSLSN